MFEVIKEYIRQAILDSVEEYDSKGDLAYHANEVALHIIAALKNAGYSITKDKNFSNGDVRKKPEGEWVFKSHGNGSVSITSPSGDSTLLTTDPFAEEIKEYDDD